MKSDAKDTDRGCFGKHPYPTLALAQRAVESVIKRKGRKYPGDPKPSAYHCETCDQFHFGHRRK